MSTLLHLIKKDLAALQWWLLAWVAICLTHLALRLAQLYGGNEVLPSAFNSTARPDFFALIFLLVLIVPQIIQLDPPGRAQSFWKTLPLSPQRVLLGKTLLLGAIFVVFPLLLEAIYFTLAGFGWSTCAALGSWFLRMFPLVCIPAGIAAFIRDRRLAALALASQTLALWQTSLREAPLSDHPDSSIVHELWSIPLACCLAAICVTVFTIKYLCRGRFAWAIVIAGFAAAYPLRSELLRLSIAWPGMSTPAVLAGHDAPNPQRAASETPPANPLQQIDLPPGIIIEADPVPDFVASNDTEHHGYLSWAKIRFSFTGASETLSLFQPHFTACRLLLPGKTLDAVPLPDQENVYAVQNSPAGFVLLPDNKLGAMPASMLSVSTPAFAVRREILEREPAYIEGRLHFTLRRLKAADSLSARAARHWNAGLSNFCLDEAQRGAAGAGILAKCTLTTPAFGTAGSHFPWSDPPPHVELTLRNSLLDLEQAFSLVLHGPVSFPSTRFTSVDLTRARRWDHFDLRAFPANPQFSGGLLGFRRKRFEARDGNLENWRLTVASWEDLGEIEIPVRVGPLLPAPIPWNTSTPTIRMYSGGPGILPSAADRPVREERQSRALRSALDGIQLQNKEDPTEVEEYLHRLVLLLSYAPESLVEYYGDSIRTKFSAVGESNLEALLRLLKHRTDRVTQGYSGPFFGQSPPFKTELSLPLQNALHAVTCDLVEARDKELVLRYLSPRVDLLDAIEKFGWQPEARAVANRFATTEALPESWCDFLVTGTLAQHRRAFLSPSPDDFAQTGIIAQIRHGQCDPNLVLRYSRALNLPENETAEAAWTALQLYGADHSYREQQWMARIPSYSQSPWRVRLFVGACRAGVADAPTDLLAALRLNEQDWRDEGSLTSDEPAAVIATMLQVFTRYSDCPVDPDAARLWLTENESKLIFDAPSRRYKIR